ncbi:uncharacterized protein V1518DRAFT_414563 [Limtongia smithiae]|uniref:uncharacterized protein n=1 Tax=Limtongia smithiae TaxID=1125753 RepID=UPI0034CF50CB
MRWSYPPREQKHGELHASMTTTTTGLPPHSMALTRHIGRGLARPQTATCWAHARRPRGVRFAMSEIDPSQPELEQVTTKIRTGVYAPIVYHTEHLDTSAVSLARAPIYTASSTFHVSATKRTAWTFAVLGGYFSSAMMTMDGVPAALALLVGIPTVLPLPLVYYFTAPYVHRIFRVYKQPAGEAVDVEKLVEDEEFVFECISAFGRGLYNCRVKLRDLRIVSRRAGWVNLEVVDGERVERERAMRGEGRQSIIEKALDGTRTRRWFYVADDAGGYRMERIWAIIEKQSGVDNGR